MRVTQILARFLSLMDISLLLLGLFIVLLASARYAGESATQKEKPLTTIESEVALDTTVRNFVESNLAPILLYACCEGEYKNQCQLLEGDFIPGRVIDIESDRDIKELVEEKKPLHPIIILISKKNSWDSFWDEQKQKEIEKIWGHKIVRVLNVEFNRQ